MTTEQTKDRAVDRGWRKGVRTLIQLVVGGALTTAVNQLAGGLSANHQVYVLTGWTVLVALLQNYAESSGKIPTLLPTKPMIKEQ